METLDILKSHSFFERMSQSDRERMLQAAVKVELAAGQFFFQEGDHCGQVALIGEGELRVFKATERGREITLYHVHHGEACVMSTSCVMMRKDYPASAKALSKVIAVVFPSELFLQWILEIDVIRTWVFETMANRLECVVTLVSDVSFRKLDRRVASFLLDRFEAESSKGPVLRMTHEELAAEMGSAREVVSRILQELRRVGAVELGRGRIQLVDRTALARATNDQ